MVVKLETSERIWWEVYKAFLEVGIADLDIELEKLTDVYGDIEVEVPLPGYSAIHERLITASGTTVTDDRIVWLIEKLKVPINMGEISIVKVAHA